MRETTERPEAVESGAAQLVGTNPDRIVQALQRLLTDEAHYRSMASAANPFGDGSACSKIVEALHAFAVDADRQAWIIHPKPPADRKRWEDV